MAEDDGLWLVNIDQRRHFPMTPKARQPNWQQKWRHIPTAKMWEAVALSLDIEPDKINHHPQGWMAGRHVFKESEEFDDRLLVACRNAAVLNGLTWENASGSDFGDSAVRLSKFAAWAISIKWEIPPEFAEIAAKEPQPSPDGGFGESETAADVEPKLDRPLRERVSIRVQSWL